MANHHTFYCPCRRCHRGSKRARRWAGRELRKKLREELRREQQEDAARARLEAQGFQLADYPSHSL